MTSRLEAVRRCLAEHAPVPCDGEAAHRAAVALVLCDGDDDLALLLIVRSESEVDRWSGHIAFPGGRVDAADAGPRATAERELREEVGLVLPAEAFLGRLDDLRGRTQGIVVSGFVYGVDAAPSLRLNYEVAEAVWLPLFELEDSSRHVQQRFHYLGYELDLPAVDVLGQEQPVLWGLSYRFLELLMRRIGRPIPTMPWRTDL